MHKKIIVIMTRIITNSLLTAAFVFGIGVTAMVTRLFGSVFLKHKHTHSSWDAPSGGGQLDRMF